MKHYDEKFRTSKTPYGENFIRRRFRTAKNPYVLKFHTAKNPYGEKSYGKNSYREKNPTVKIPVTHTTYLTGHHEFIKTIKLYGGINGSDERYNPHKRNDIISVLLIVL